MNKIYILIIFISLINLTGCEKFLEEYSQNEIRPSSTVDLQQLLAGEVYPIGTSFFRYLDYMTDDVISNFSPRNAESGLYTKYYAPFTWRKDMFEIMDKQEVSYFDTYDHYYRRIKGCNVVMEMIEEVRGSEEEKGNVKGQALALRGYFYFMLVNCFGQPYNAVGVDIKQSPGVPLILSSIVTDDYPKRASIAEIYEQIEKDLLEALPLIKNYGKNNNRFRVTEQFILTLLSRFYLYMEDWGNAENYASQALEINSSLTNLINLPYPNYYWSYYYDPDENVYSLTSVEVIWFGYAPLVYEYVDYGGYENEPIPFTVSQELINIYDSDLENAYNRKDLRLRFYYSWEYEDSDWTIPRIRCGAKQTFQQNTPENARGAVKGFRVAELYLNRAEAYIQQCLKTGNMSLCEAALNDLNFLRLHRYDTRNVAYENIIITDPQELLQFCRDERRRELNFEDHRWFDLRRYGMPRIEHVIRMSESQAAETYILEEGGDRWVFPIPASALKKNPSLVANP